ncbi:MAG: DUF3347 domain-containing protein [Ignavibacteria bacterium]|nr:DUF3347 domain-containing protein [Ignavibacteria bacterium]
MKNKLVLVLLLAAASVFVSCTKEDRREVKQTIDSASTTLGRDVDTIINSTLSNDSVFEKTAFEPLDPGKLKVKEFRSIMNDIFDNYIDIKEELEEDDTADVRKQSEEMKKILMSTATSAVQYEKSTEWKNWLTTFEKITADLSGAKDLITQRKFFAEMSVSLENMLTKFGVKGKDVYKLTCSSLKERSFWFTDSKDRDNPYYGKDKTNEKSEQCVEVVKAWKFD